MKRFLNWSIIVFFVSLNFYGCKDDEIPAESLMVNKWIQQQMATYYLWNEYLPRISPSSYADPEVYFDALKYKKADRFSYLTSDAQTLLNQLDGNELSMGFSPSFARVPNTDKVYFVIEYVYKNSPAEVAGLKRGDIVVAINNIDLTVQNYRSLYGKSSYTVTLGEYQNSNGVVKTNKTISLTAATIEKDPIIHTEIIDYNSLKIGYLAYAEFISGDDDRWLNKLKEALEGFENAGVTEMIVDLRYNPGGQIKVAGVLASAIAPKSISDNSSVLVKMSYNKLVQDHLTKDEGANSENFIYKFPQTDINLNLSRVVFLTGFGSASASELLINGLEPYMNVIQIGEITVGKCYGSIVLYDENTPPKHNYAMMPLIMKYANANGVTDFFEGLNPDYFIEDNLFDTKPFGSLDDPITSAAIRYLNGEDVAARIRHLPLPYIPLSNEDKLIKGNILLSR